MRHAIFNADDEGRLGGALHNARGKNADDAAMPAVAIDHQQPRSGEIRIVGESRFDGGERGGLGFAALAIEALQLVARARWPGRRSRVQKSSMISDATSMRPAALMRGARRKATSKPVSGFGGGIESRGRKQRAQTRRRRDGEVRAAPARR